MSGRASVLLVSAKQTTFLAEIFNSLRITPATLKLWFCRAHCEVHHIHETYNEKECSSIKQRSCNQLKRGFNVHPKPLATGASLIYVFFLSSSPHVKHL